MILNLKEMIIFIFLCLLNFDKTLNFILKIVKKWIEKFIKFNAI